MVTDAQRAVKCIELKSVWEKIKEISNYKDVIYEFPNDFDVINIVL